MSNVRALHDRMPADAADEDTAGDRVSSSEQIAWAGLPVNLDLTFSSRQRDKVYTQHLKRRLQRRLDPASTRFAATS